MADKNDVRVNLFGPPMITFGDERILFPLKKTEGLFYYMLLNKTSTREHIASMFWQDRDEVSAANNLRNSIYMLRKIFSHDIIRSDKRNIEMNPCFFQLDYPLMQMIANPSFPEPQTYAREFMEGFEILESELFTTWLRDKRRAVREEFLEYMRGRIELCYDSHNTLELKRSLSLIFSCDISDESYVLELMQLHADEGCLSKALRIFREYEKRLKNELSLSPSKRACDFYNKLSSVPQDVKDRFFFFGRDSELKKIRTFMNKNRLTGACINIYGEPGVGKTSLAKHLAHEIEQAGELVLTAKAHDFGNKYFFSPWYEIFRELNTKCDLESLEIDPIKLSILSATFPGTFAKPLPTPNYGMTSIFTEPSPILIGHILGEIFRKIRSDGNILLLLEDIQWFDEMSMHLLVAFLSELQYRFTIVTTSRTKSGRPMRNMLENLSMRGDTELLSIELTPFSLNETALFLESVIDTSNLKNLDIEVIHLQTYGLPLFLAEVVNSIKNGEDIKKLHEKIHNFLAWCFRDVTAEQQELLETASVFSNGTTLAAISDMLGSDALSLSKLIEQVVGRGILYEREDERGEIKLCFRHARLQDFFYESMPQVRSRELHRRLAELMEKNYGEDCGDPSLSAELCYHFNLASMPEKELEFMLREMRTHVIFSHEQFPSLDDERLKKAKGILRGKFETLSRLETLKKQLFDLDRKRMSLRNYLEMEATILELQGGYMIGWGQYEDGMQAINRGMESAIANEFKNIHLNCLKHTCYHGIQAEDVQILEKQGQHMLFVAREYNDELHQAMAFRFLGFSKKAEGDFEEAEALLLQSIEMLEKLSRTGRVFTMGVLAAWSYIGEIYQCKGELQRSLDIFERCIGQSGHAGISWGLSHFYSKAGDVAFDMGNMELARKYVSKSISLFENGEGGRSGSIGYSLAALFSAEDGKYKLTAKYLQRSKILCVPIKKPSWIAVHNFAQYLIKSSFGQHFDTLLPALPLEYKEMAMKLCQRFHMSSKLEYLRFDED